MSDNPILLTPDDVGCEFMRHDGYRVECKIHTTLGYFHFNDGLNRHPDGRCRGAFPKSMDLASRITEQVA